MHPSLGALVVADAPPLPELADDLDRHRTPHENPLHRIAASGAGAQVRPVGGEAREARKRQARRIRLRRAAGACGEQPRGKGEGENGAAEQRTALDGGA